MTPDILKRWEEEAKERLRRMGDTSDGSFEFEKLIPKRILLLIEAVRVMDKALETYAHDAWDSTTSLGDYDDEGYGKTARQARARAEEILNGNA